MSTSFNTVASEGGPIRAQDYVNVGDTLFYGFAKDQYTLIEQSLVYVNL